jgi:hypothetical protein
MLKRLKHKILNLVIKHLFNGVTEQDVLKVVNGKMYHRGTALPAKYVESITSSARLIRELDVYKHVMTDTQYAANKRMYIDGTNADDILFGKAMLYCLEVIDLKFKNLSNMK